jgi:cholesterol transport system auxiliary component
MKRPFGGILVALVLLLAACKSQVVPDMTYHRLPSPTPLAVPPLAVPLPVDVTVFSADGLYAEQSIIFALDADARALRTYHYQLWSDPPARTLQRRLIRMLRDAKISPLVTDRLPGSADALRISGVILHYDRVGTDAARRAEVMLQLRVERGAALLLERVYSAEVDAADGEMRSTVVAFGKAVDSVYADFAADLTKLELAVADADAP